MDSRRCGSGPDRRHGEGRDPSRPRADAVRARAPRNATIAASRSRRSGARRCPACAPASPASRSATRRSSIRPSTAAAARIASCARRCLGRIMARPPEHRGPPGRRDARRSRSSRPPRRPVAQPPAGLPSRKQILDFIASSDQPAGKREIARAFGLSGQDKIDLKRLLKDMADEGLIDSSPGRAFHQIGRRAQGHRAARRRGRRQRQRLGGARAMACRNARRRGCA